MRDRATGQVYLAYAENYAARGPANIVLNLTSVDIQTRRGRELAEIKRQLEDARKRNATGDVERLTSKLASEDKRGFCELLDNSIKVMEALKFDSIEITRANKARFNRGCA